MNTNRILKATWTMDKQQDRKMDSLKLKIREQIHEKIDKTLRERMLDTEYNKVAFIVHETVKTHFHNRNLFTGRSIRVRTGVDLAIIRDIGEETRLIYIDERFVVCRSIYAKLWEDIENE